MEYFILLLGGFFYSVVAATNVLTMHGLITAEMKEYFNKEIRKVEESYDLKLKEMQGEIRMENALLKRENHQLLMKLHKENKKNSRDIMKLQNNLKNAEKQFMSEMEAFKLQMRIEHQEKDRQIDDLKADIKQMENLVICAYSKENMSVENTVDFREIRRSSVSFQTQDEAGITLRKPHKRNRNSSTSARASREIDVNKGAHDKKRQSSSESTTKVAFFARLTSTPHLDPNQDIVFDNVVTNVGAGYYNHHGTFIAPVQGIYVFSTTLVSYVSGTHHAKIVKNGEVLARLENSDANGYDTAGLTVVSELQKGDAVAVQNDHQANTVYTGSNYSIFSGFLLYEYSDGPVIVGK